MRQDKTELHFLVPCWCRTAEWEKVTSFYKIEITYYDAADAKSVIFASGVVGRQCAYNT